MNHTYLEEKESQLWNEQMLVISAQIFEASILLKKTLKNSENIIRESIKLYSSLKEHQASEKPIQISEVSSEVLKISSEVHEVKKDSYRVLTNLQSLFSELNVSTNMDIERLINVIVQANHNYARIIGKKVKISSKVLGCHPNYEMYPILSIINNLVENSIESFDVYGKINISMARQEERAVITVSDDGPGILSKHRDLIFQPGFTTKFNHIGFPSSGLGLVFVKELVEGLKGEISVKSDPEEKGCQFTILLPLHKIARR